MTTKYWAGSFVLVVFFSASSLLAADAKSDTSADGKQAAAATNPAADAASDAGHIKGRLPSGWGKLGLTDIQKQAIYKVQSTYNSQISAMEAKRDAEMRKVLTTAQQNLLTEQAEAKAAAKAAKMPLATSDKADPPAPATSAKKTNTSTKSSSTSADSPAAVAESK